MLDLTNIDNYPYTFELTGNESLRRSTTSFGDGYSETRVKGINPLLSTWEVSFIFTSLATAQAFIAALRTNYGAVLWLPPVSTTSSKYLINNWSIVPESPINYTVRCSLKKWIGN